MLRGLLFVFLLVLLAGLPSLAWEPPTPAQVAAFRAELLRVDGLTLERFDDLYQRYYKLLQPEEPWLPHYPLESLRGDVAYQAKISQLLQSPSEHDQRLALMVVTSANDSHWNDQLLEKEETYEVTVRGLVLQTLLALKDPRTSELFDAIVRYSPHNTLLTDPLAKLDPASLRRTALARITSENADARFLAARILGSIPWSEESEQAIRQAVLIGDTKFQYCALPILVEHHIGNTRPLVEALSAEQGAREWRLALLAGSPTPEDQAYLRSLAEQAEVWDSGLVGVFLHSGRPDNARYWLTMLSSPKLPPDYTFWAFEQAVLSQDELHRDLLDALSKVQSPSLLAQLAEALRGRDDSESVSRLLQLCRHPVADVRRSAGKALEGVKSPLIAAEVGALARDPQLRTDALASMAVANDVDDLHDAYQGYLSEATTDGLWNCSAVYYLSAFPRPQDAALFRAILSGDEAVCGNEETYPQMIYAQQSAAWGLAVLGDHTVVPLIAQVLRRTDTDNYLTFLEPLAYLKSDEAKSVLETYRDVDYQPVSDFVKEQLATWP